MSAYATLQEREFELARTSGYSADRHQRFVGTGYFDEISNVIAGGASSVTALDGSTENEQFTLTVPGNGAMPHERDGLPNFAA